MAETGEATITGHLWQGPRIVPTEARLGQVVGGIKGLGDGSLSDGGKNGGRSSFRQRKLNRLSGGAKRKHDPFEEPLPIMYRMTPAESYERLALPYDAKAAMWRDYTPESPVIATFTLRPKAPGLFDTVPLSRCPLEPLVSVTRTFEPKVRRQRELMQRDLTVRVARKHLGYCIHREIKEPLPEELVAINAKIQAVFPERSLTAAEVKCWCYPERALTGEVHRYYTDALAAYQRNSNDVIDLLAPEIGRFANLSPERMEQLRLLARAVRNCPFDERDGILQELPGLQALKAIWPTDVETAESITVTKGDKSIKLSALASSIYQCNFTQLKAVCKLLSKQSEVGRRIKQPLSAPRPQLNEEPRRKRPKEDMPMVLQSTVAMLGAQSLGRDTNSLDATVRCSCHPYFGASLLALLFRALYHASVFAASERVYECNRLFCMSERNCLLQYEHSVWTTYIVWPKWLEVAYFPRPHEKRLSELRSNLSLMASCPLLRLSLLRTTLF